MTRHIHRQFLSAASRVSPALRTALLDIGQISLETRRGLSLPHFLARVIVGQQLSTTAARSIWARVEVAVTANGSSVPEFFTEKNKRLLRQCGLSAAKAQALIAIREAHEAGLLSSRKLRNMDHTQRSEHLMTIWGIGQWTADMTSIFYFGDADVWPAGDGGVHRAFCELTGKRSKTSLAKLAQGFAPYRSFLALYLWRYLDGPREKAPRNKKQPV